MINVLNGTCDYRTLFKKEMEKELQQSKISFNSQKRYAQSNDLRHRLFEIGLNNSPKKHVAPYLHTHMGTPKNKLQSKHPLANLHKQNSSKLLRYQPQHSPPMIKTHGKDFHIRKNIKLPFSPKASSNAHTVSAFYPNQTHRVDPQELRDTLYQAREKQEQFDACVQIKEPEESRLDDYVNLILKGVDKIEQFLYLVRGSQENVYELELVSFEKIRAHQGQPNFQYYTVSKKGFCRYVGGKPQTFLQIADWAEEKHLYSKIKSLKFFYRFRRWKTLQMWRRTVTRQRRQSIASNLQERLFLLEPTTRKTLIELRKLTLQMEKSVLIIARNEGTYTLESFKHCQQRARREASLAVEQFSRESRSVVRKCFDNRLTQLRENIKKNISDDKQTGTINNVAQSPKENAFQALGFPSKMSYEHRSKLRKQTGKFLRFSYLVDNLHLSCLADLYSSQVNAFITRLEELQLEEPVKMRATIEQGKDEMNNERIFALQLHCNFKEIPSRLISQLPNKEGFMAVRDVRLKGQTETGSLWVYRIAEHWLSMQPNIEEVLDQLTFLLREGLSSLKCFQRWSKHRQMQKYVSILQQWDDLVSEHWQISENDNLDPLIIIDNIDPILSRLKNVLRVTETKFNDSIRTIMTSLLNSYWQYQRLDLTKLQNIDLLNPAETFEQFLLNITQLLEQATQNLPHRMELGIIILHVTKVKNMIGQKFATIIEKLKKRLPELVEERTIILNDWLSIYGNKLREEILNIDDYVRTVNVIKEAQLQFGQRRDECSELSQMYQTMQQFKMDTRKRKDFQTVTLKLKDQLDQLIIAAEQNIERKAELYTKEVIRYHLPNLLKDISKTIEIVEHPRFLQFTNDRQQIIGDLQKLQQREKELIDQNMRCSSYMGALKLTHQNIESLEDLSRQIKYRVTLWHTFEQWERFAEDCSPQVIKEMQLSIVVEQVERFRQIIIDLEKNLPQNQVLDQLKQKNNQFYINLPLLSGLSQSLSECHWNQIYDTLPEKFSLDLKKKQFTLQEFLNSKAGDYAKEIQDIFEKSRVEARLQYKYQLLEEEWNNLTARIKVEGKFNLIANGPTLRQDLNKVLLLMTQNLSDPFSQSLKQYSITYETLLSSQQTLEQWLSIQDRLTELEKLCKLLDIKKLPEYTHFENAQRLYKQISKITLIKGSQSGVKLGKLLASATEDKLSQISINMTKVEDIIKNILAEHRKAFPTFYLFEDESLIKMITENTHENIEQAAKYLLPGLKELEFQNDRITALITIDGDRLIKNPISITSEMEQILFQLSDTMSELHRRTMRMCRYKAIQNNLTTMVDQFNIQHLLAISRVDFSHYTTISIENQQQTPQSLAQFRRVMRKDTAEDIRNRQFLKEEKSIKDTSSNNHIQKYDTLLLQQLIYEEILDQLIKANIENCEEFIWASQLKFFWQDTTADEPNITIKQLHLNLKYGNEFLGSITKVIIQNEPELLLGLKLNENIVYTGNQYSMERLFNAIGYKMLAMYCSPKTTKQQLSRFSIGCYFSDFLPILCSADLLTPQIKYSLDYQQTISDFKTTALKKNSPYVKQIDRSSTLFTLLRDTTTNVHSFSQSFRVVNYKPPSGEILKSGMQLMGLYSPEKNSLLLRIFQLVKFLEQRSQLQGVALEKFLDETINEEADLDQYRLFTRLLKHLKPCIAVQTHNALTKHLENLGLVPMEESQRKEKKSKITEIVQCLWSRGVVILGGRGDSKKYYLEQELSKDKIKPIYIFGKSLINSNLFTSSIVSSLVSKYPSEQKYVFYIEELTPELLLSFEKLVYFDKQFQAHKGKIAFILDIPILDKFIDPHAIHSFPIFNFEQPKQHIDSILNEWTIQNVPEDSQKGTVKAFQQIVIPCLEAINVREDLVIESKFNYFLKYYSTLLPVTNIVEACIYTLALIYRGKDEELLKIDYLTKKQLPEQYFTGDTHINQLIFCKHLPKQSMISQQQYLKWFIEEQNFKERQIIMTPQYAHLLLATRRIHNRQTNGVALVGKGNSGKSTFLKLYRQLNHQNSFYLTISTHQHRQWHEKINKTLHHHGLNLLGARINYKETIIMVEDVHMSQKQTFEPIYQMMVYQKWQNSKQEFNLKKVKFIITGQQIPQNIEKNALKLHISSDNDKLKNIFGQLLSQTIQKEWNVPTQIINKMAADSLQICKKVTQERDGYLEQTFTTMKRIIMGFAFLKSKESPNPIKELEKYWTFALHETLRSYNSSILEAEFKNFDLTHIPLLNFTHLFAKPLEKKLQSIKDNKRIFNMLNERIERYNEGEIKRYGDNFEFINFDSLLEKVLAISHSVLMEQDHMLVGRKGAGKESLVKLAAFFNGLHFKIIGNNIKDTVLQLFDGVIPTPHLLLRKINNQEDISSLEDYCYCDFQSQILGQSQSKPRVGIREKDKDKPPAMTMMKTVKRQQQFSDTYTMPKVKPTCEDTDFSRKLIRLVVTLNEDTLSFVNKSLRKHFHFDICTQVPTTSIIQYNEKLLDVDAITCTKEAQLLVSQIYEYSRQKLGISLRGNDDCIRLFSSFITNLIPQMTSQSQKFSKVLSLLEKLRTANVIISQGLEECHLKLKQLSKQLDIDKDEKTEIQLQLRERSTALAVNQKLTEIMSWLEPNYMEKHEKYQYFLEDRNRLELIFAITASYFIYLSNCSYQNRRKVLKEWYQNIPIMKNIPMIESFLPLFLLSEEQFNAEPVDDAVDFYENMAIIFHSAKPVAIRDECQRGKQWLEKNCSFVHLRQNSKDFIEMLSDHLTKPTNILIEVTEQETINNINESPIGTLLFLPESVTSVNLLGQEVAVHQEAKVYMLLGSNIVLPKQTQAQFTVVLFQENFQISKKAFVHEYLSCVHREHQYTKLDYKRKLRNIKLDCQNVMSQVAQNLYEQLIGQQELSQVDLSEQLSKVNDKLMIKAQNQFTKIKQKQDLAKDLQEKYVNVSAKIQPHCGQDFHLVCEKILEVLKFMDSKISQQTWKPIYPEFFQIIRNSLMRGIVTNIPSLLLFALRQWGPMYNHEEYLIYSMLLVMVYHKRSIEQFTACLTSESIINGDFLGLINRPKVEILKIETVEKQIAEAFIDIFKKEQWLTIQAFLKSKENVFQPLIWINNQTESFQKIIQLLTRKNHHQLKEKLSSENIKYIEPTQQDSLESLLKKNQNEHLYVIIFDSNLLQEYKRVLKHWNLREQSTIMLKGQSVQKNIWSVNVENGQQIFKTIIQRYREEQISKIVQNSEGQSGVRNESARQSHQSSLNNTQVLQDIDFANDKTFKFTVNLARAVKSIYNNQELPTPLLTNNELIMLRKSLENVDIPLPLFKKVKCIISYINVTLAPIPESIQTVFNSLQAKIIKACSKSTEEQFFIQSDTILSQFSEINQNKHDETIKIMKMQLGWLSSLRSLMKIDNQSIRAPYINKLDRYINEYDRCREQPTISRSIKRHSNLKNRKQFMVKKNRDSTSKKNQNKQPLPVRKPTKSQLSSILLLKESENYEQLLTKIHHDLLACKKQIETPYELPNDEVLINLIHIMQDSPAPCWKPMLTEFGCDSNRLEDALTNLLERRNELYTLYNKFNVSDTCEIEMRYMKKPEQFLKTYFGTEFNTKDGFVLSAQLSHEQTERQHLRLVGLWSCGWKLSSEGALEYIGEGKIVQLGACYLIKKCSEGVGSCPIDVSVSSTAQPFMRVQVASKKTLSSLKLFLHHSS